MALQVGSWGELLPPAKASNLPSQNQTVIEASNKANAQYGPNASKVFEKPTVASSISGTQIGTTAPAFQTVIEISSGVIASISREDAEILRGSDVRFREGLDDVIVKLVSTVFENDIVTFKVMPEIAETRQASYEPVSISHHPGEILRYKSTTARTWNMSSIKIISRTSAEASANLTMLNLIRSWVMPFYGYGTERDHNEYLGAPPDVLTFSAYGPRNVGPVPVVLEGYTWTYPVDVDYIPTDTGEPFPVFATLGLNLKESWSPREYSAFSISDYTAGNMKDAFNIENIPAPKTRPAGSAGQAKQAEAQQADIPYGKADQPPSLKVSADAFEAEAQAGKKQKDVFVSNVGGKNAGTTTRG